MAERIKGKEALIEWAASGEADGCVVWPYAKSHNGYAQTQWDGKMQRVSRVVCEMAHGPAPKDKPLTLHKCGNPSCINANHLYWGDYFDNFADRDRDGTTACAERNGKAKLTNDEVCEIRSGYLSGDALLADLADAYGVHANTISRVITGKSYGTVECETD